jgi:hypothetical protein
MLRLVVGATARVTNGLAGKSSLGRETITPPATPNADAAVSESRSNHLLLPSMRRLC